MKNNYGLFNCHDENDTLLILFSDENVTSKKSNNEVDVLYHNDIIVGYKICNFIRYAKIKYSGIIFYPNKILIDVINSVLINSNLETIAYKNGSGYIIKKNNNGLGVFACEGTFLRDGTISNGRFCTYFDLFIENNNQNSIIVIDDYSLENKDFFGN